MIGEASPTVLPKSTVKDGRYIQPGLNAERGNSTDIIGHDARVAGSNDGRESGRAE